MNPDSLGAPVKLMGFAVAFLAMILLGYVLGRIL